MSPEEELKDKSRGGAYLPALCRPSSGHLLLYIKGFALISMPLRSQKWRVCVFIHTNSDACVCVLSCLRDVLTFVPLCVHEGLVWP